MKKLYSMLLLFLLLITKSFAASVTLAWNANSETNVAGYKIHYGQSAGAWNIHIDVGNVITATVSNLGNGPYYFVVTAYDTDRQESDPSNEVSWSMPLLSPSNLRIVSLTTNNVSINVNFAWDSPSNYIIQMYSLKGTNGIVDLTNTNIILAGSFTNKLTGTISNLYSGIYRFRALTFNPTSNIKSSLTLVEPSINIITKPRPPTGFGVTSFN